MSQEKVARYKEEKANRKKLMKKAKRKAVLMKLAGSLVAIALVVLIGTSAYSKYEENKERPSVTVDYSAVQDYIQTLSAEEE